MNYWEECIAEALDEAGISATKEQISSVAAFVGLSHENYGMAHGYDCIPNPVETQAQEQLRKLQREIKKREDWEASTKPCPKCLTSGHVLDIWGRDVTCLDCDGEGRI